MMLASQFGELCTMCEATVVCRSVREANGSGASFELDSLSDASFVLYHFRTKTFWGQIATIWDYFARWFDPVTSEERPVDIYRQRSDAGVVVRQASLTETAYLSKADAQIFVQGRRIDRWTGEWAHESGAPLGTCVRTDLRETLPFIERLGPWAE